MNKETADLLQLIALPLELVGLALATIEIRCPDSAIKLRRFITSNAQQLPTPSKWTRPFDRAWFNLLFGASIFFGLLLTVDPQNPQLSIILSIIIVGLVLPFASFRVAKDWMPGREVGAVGILMMSYGVLLECYQIAVVLSG